MRLSLVIPCYNEEKCLPECFTSISRQTVLPDEIIFANNKSTDNSLQIAENWAQIFNARHVDFKIINVSPQGIVPTRTAGFQAASGDLITSIDSDSRLDPDFIKTSKDFFRGHPGYVALVGTSNSYQPGLSALLNSIGIPHIASFVSEPLRFIPGFGGTFTKNAYASVGGLSDYPVIAKALKFKLEPYDDFILSEKLRLVGKIGFSWKLKVSRRAKDDFRRTFYQLVNFYRIRRIIKSQYVEKKSPHVNG